MRNDVRAKVGWPVAWLLLALAGAPGCGRPSAGPPAAAGDTLALLRRVDHLDVVAREPMIVEHPDGTLFVAGYSRALDARPELWKSTDHGATWTRVDVGTEDQGAVGNSDTDLAVGPDGTLYLVELVFDRPAFEGQGVAIGVSHDVGSTWSWTRLSRTRFDDRPWVDVAPDGTAHVIWNDGRGVSHAVSTDQGRSWTELGRIHDLGGSSHLAVGTGGDVAVRITPMSASGHRFDAGVDLLAVSTDGGRTWRKHAPPGRLDWSAEPGLGAAGYIPRWVEPLAWDAAGRLYHLWTDSTGVWLGRSADRGESWTRWRLVEPSVSFLAFYPYLVTRDSGTLAASWFTADLDALREGGQGAKLLWHAALVTLGEGDPKPELIESEPLPIDAWAPRVVGGDTLRVPDTAGEYVGISFLRSGGMAVVTPIQDFDAGRQGFTFWRFGSSSSRLEPHAESP
jgi:hypothetical protein